MLTLYYDTFIKNTLYFTCLMSVLRFEKCENMVHYRRGGNLPPATWQLQPVRLNGTT